MWTHPLRPVGEVPRGGATRARGVPKWARGRHVDAPDGAIGGAPWWARNVRGICRNGRGGAMWTHPLGPLVELPGWHVRRNGRGDAIWTHPLGPLVERPGGHETCEGFAEMGAGSPCGRTRWGHMWSHNEGVPPVLISVLVNFQRAFAVAPSALPGWCGASIYRRIPPRAPSHRCVCAISVCLSAPSRAPSHPRLGFTGGVHLCIYLCHAWSPSHGRRFACDLFFLHIYLTSPTRRHTSLSSHLCGHVSYVTQRRRFSPWGSTRVRFPWVPWVPCGCARGRAGPSCGSVGLGLGPCDSAWPRGG